MREDMGYGLPCIHVDASDARVKIGEEMSACEEKSEPASEALHALIPPLLMRYSSFRRIKPDKRFSFRDIRLRAISAAG